MSDIADSQVSIVSKPPAPRSGGLVYTFYSYKGGVGRSMAVANIAALFCKWGKRVLIVDWDLEAPGIERYFEEKPSYMIGSRAEKAGMLDILCSFATDQIVDWRECLIEAHPFGDESSLHVLSAGLTGEEYSAKVQNLNWNYLFNECSLASRLAVLREEWIENFDCILIDSRTGINDIGAICTVLLPDVLVVMFSSNHQSIDGTAEVLAKAQLAQHRLAIDRGRVLSVPVLSRDESQTEYLLAQKWRTISAQILGGFYREWLPEGQTEQDVLNRLYIPYIAYWSFGERLPVAEEANKMNDPRSIVSAYARLAKLLVKGVDWTNVDFVPQIPPTSPPSTIRLERNLIEVWRVVEPLSLLIMAVASVGALFYMFSMEKSPSGGMLSGESPQARALIFSLGGAMLNVLPKILTLAIPLMAQGKRSRKELEKRRALLLKMVFSVFSLIPICYLIATAFGKETPAIAIFLVGFGASAFVGQYIESTMEKLLTPVKRPFYKDDE